MSPILVEPKLTTPSMWLVSHTPWPAWTSFLRPTRTAGTGMVGDISLAVVVALAGLPSALTPHPHLPGAASRVLLDVGLAFPLVWRRRYPSAAFAAVSVVALAQLLTGVRLFADVALLAAFYTVAMRCSPRRTILAALTLGIGIVLATVRWAPARVWLLVLVMLCGMATAAYFIGITMRTRRAHVQGLEVRARDLEHERDQQAQLAAATERARIARDMHDIVAHSLSVIIALSDGASLIVAEEPERAGTAMAQVSSTGRQALTEMRRLLDVLHDDRTATFQPQPGIADVDRLLEQVRQVGLRGQLTTEGRPQETLPAGLQLVVYRLVQEALTNVLKHAVGATATVVCLRLTPGRLDVEVCNNGQVAVETTSTDGRGLVGMRERAALYGGVVEAGPLPGGGWRVHSSFEPSSWEGAR